MKKDYSKIAATCVAGTLLVVYVCIFYINARNFGFAIAMRYAFFYSMLIALGLVIYVTIIFVKDEEHKHEIKEKDMNYFHAACKRAVTDKTIGIDEMHFDAIEAIATKYHLKIPEILQLRYNRLFDEQRRRKEEFRKEEEEYARRAMQEEERLSKMKMENAANRIVALEKEVQRIMLGEISELLDMDEDDVVEIVKTLVKERRIDAYYFEKTNYLVFKNSPVRTLDDEFAKWNEKESKLA